MDETKLSKIDRLGLAYCRLNAGEWDEILGPKPNGFDDLPKYPEDPKWLWQKGKLSQADFTWPAMNAIESIIGDANTSRCWWLFQLGKTEEEWFRWYVTERFKGFPESIR